MVGHDEEIYEGERTMSDEAFWPSEYNTRVYLNPTNRDVEIRVRVQPETQHFSGIKDGQKIDTTYHDGVFTLKFNTEVFDEAHPLSIGDTP